MPNKRIHRRVRIRQPGLNVDSVVDAVVSVNVSGSGSDRKEEPRSGDDDRGLEPDQTPPAEREKEVNDERHVRIQAVEP